VGTFRAAEDVASKFEQLPYSQLKRCVLLHIHKNTSSALKSPSVVFGCFIATWIWNAYVWAIKCCK